MSENNPQNPDKTQKPKVKLPPSIDPDPEFVIIPLLQATSEDSQVDVAKIQELCALGLDSSRPEDRAAAWLVLSHIFPTDPLKIPEFRRNNKNSYLEYVKDLNMVGYERATYPISTEVTVFREGIDNELMSLIFIDVMRTPHHINFFPFQDNDIEVTTPEESLAPFHQQMRRIERVLYIFAKLNSTVSYLQGMNEIIAVIFYAFSMAISFFSCDQDEMESFVFTQFQNLYGSTKLNEMYVLQDRSSIIHSRLNQFMSILQRHFPKGHQIITAHNIDPTWFCYRWLSLLFSQEYYIPKLILIWDALFAHFDNLMEYSTYIAAARVKMLEKFISLNDYVATLEALKNKKLEDVECLLELANAYWLADHPQKGRIFDKMSSFFKKKFDGIQLPHFKTQNPPNSASPPRTQPKLDTNNSQKNNRNDSKPDNGNN